MNLRDSIAHVLNNYLAASLEIYASHPLANFIRNDLRDAVATAVGESGRLTFKGSAGQSTWVRGPWVGIFDPLVTTTSQKGYYPVYLFREDMKGVYLSLNQGMTEMKSTYKSSAKAALHARAKNFRAMLGAETDSFSENEINLAPSSSSNDTAFYEAGNICAKYYAVENLPSNVQFVDDLQRMLKVYQMMLESELNTNAAGALEGDEPAELQYEDATKFRLHKRIERNRSLVKKVKKSQGYTCKVCGINFQKQYGAIGEGYIEAHHLKPISSLKGTVVAMDPIKDFAVLCSNCHRMIHRSNCLDDINKFKLEHYRSSM